jgi:transposase
VGKICRIYFFRTCQNRRRDRSDLFRFVTSRDLPYAGNACEQALRPSVIFRKVTGCFRSKGSAEVYPQRPR